VEGVAWGGEDSEEAFVSFSLLFSVSSGGEEEAFLYNRLRVTVQDESEV
jgi:hypothetical protein